MSNDVVDISDESRLMITPRILAPSKLAEAVIQRVTTITARPKSDFFFHKIVVVRAALPLRSSLFLGGGMISGGT